MLTTGAVIVTRLRNTNSEIAGFPDLWEAEVWAIIPFFAANAGPTAATLGRTN